MVNAADVRERFFSRRYEKDDKSYQDRLARKNAAMERVERIDGEQVNRGLVPGRKVLVSAEAAAVVIPRPEAHACAPKIDLIRDGDVIQAIDVTCGCGQRIRLRCVYETA